jgi:hypothetical protein
MSETKDDSFCEDSTDLNKLFHMQFGFDALKGVVENLFKN